MRFTRRLLDGQKAAALVIATCLATVGAVASCSSDDDSKIDLVTSDAAVDASTTGADADDAGVSDASPPRDASPFDGGPLPVVCTATPCATSLVTTFGGSDALYTPDRSEGFCALLADGTVACWGANGAGQLGRGDDAGTLDDPTAARVLGLSDIAQLDHTCARDQSGGVWCWGTGPFLRNDAGAVTTERSPVKLPLPPVKSIAVGRNVSCAAIDDGITCWGKNDSGQLAPFESTPASAVVPPRPIELPSGAPIREIAVSAATFVVREDGTVSSWGANPPLARLSALFPDPNPSAIALEPISSLDVASNAACATAGGTGYCWGGSYSLTIVDQPDDLDRALPEPVRAPEPLVQIATTRVIFQTVAPGNRTVAQPQRWCAVAAPGAVYCWGYNSGGQAGDATKNHAFEAVRVQGLPAPAAQVKTMLESTCALLTNGKVYCWGTNYYGQLGNGQLRSPSLVPQEVVLP